MLESLLVPIIVAAYILYRWLRDVKAEVEKAARDDENHKR